MTNARPAPAGDEKHRQAILQHFYVPWADLTDAEKYQRRHSARYMALTPRKLSPAAQKLHAALMMETIIPFKQSRLATPLRPSTLEGLSSALAVWLPEVLAAANRGLWVQHSVRRDAFAGKGIGWQHFVDVKDALEQAGLIVGVKGRWDQTKGFGKVNVYVAPIFRMTPELLEVAEGHGVTPWDVGIHFWQTGEGGREGDDDGSSMP